LEGRKKQRDRILNILKVVVSLGLLMLLLTRVDVGQTLQRLAEMDWLAFSGAMALYLAGLLVRAYRWGFLIWALDVQVAWRRLVALYFVGSFFSLLLPTGVGGDAVKMYELSRDSQKATAAISSVLVDRFLGLFVLFALALVALVGGYQLVSYQVRILIAIVFVGCLLGAVLILQRTWIEACGRWLGVGRLLGRIKILQELYGSIHLYGPAALLRSTAASVLFNLMLILGNYLLGLAVDIHLPLWYYFLFVPLISALLMIPSIGGLGVREGAYVFLFGQVGVDQDHGLALAIAYDLTLLLTGVVGAIIYVFQGIQEARR
jgi:uncharacterized membrane protein YbhN (UPF0104 family)